jgi:hypothetical protein
MKPVYGSVLVLSSAISIAATDLSQPLAAPRGDGSPIDLVRVAQVPLARTIVDRFVIDCDNDGNREFVIQRDSNLSRLEFFESAVDNSFTLVHVIDSATGSPPSSTLRGLDVGDADGDGKCELVVRDRPGGDWRLRVYEAQTSRTYPSVPVWDLFDWSSLRGGRIADSDGDGAREIVLAGTLGAEDRLAVFESSSDDSFESTYSGLFPDGGSSQFLRVAEDVDGDGSDEVLSSAFIPDGIRLYALEAIGESSYEEVWHHDLLHSNGQPVNGSVIVDAGDLDRDGRREFLVGGTRTIAQEGDPFFEVFFLFETTGDNSFEVVATMTFPSTLAGLSSAAVADVDGDGSREIVVGEGPHVEVHENVGDNAWSLIWSRTHGALEITSLGAGDHDRDGKDELLIQERGFSQTGVYEIRPAFQADADADGVVDAIDNCRLVANPQQTDVDGDAIGDSCDNCAGTYNPNQGPAVFPSPIEATSRTEFGWPAPADIVWVRGYVAEVASYAVALVNEETAVTALRDATVPSAGSGFFYLVRPDCPAGSWQTTAGAEPGRDAALP